MANKVYWTTKDGSSIDIDEMSIEHLRNVLKMIVRQHVHKRCPRNIDDARDFEIEEESDLGRDVNDLLSIPFSESEARALLYKTRYQQENEDNIWK